MDNWFTSVPTCKELLTKNITTVGTLNKNKPEIPDQFKTTQDKAIKESIFVFQSDCTLMNNSGTKTIRRHYLQEVGFELARPYIEHCILMQNIPRSIKMQGRQLLGLLEQPPQPNLPIRGGVGRCYFCSRARDQSTRKQCSKCMRRICSYHQVTVYPQCVENQQNL
ncbi:hypothetical protein EVAR_88406_1 [Eumeta japonica]|uniref:PiggyBac transposable element-derived protein domain-containing protein n=1 Tax=Eumeta variegata TaxID=151549 RepID=A0A4C1Y0T5_EUMVA|nr:hypothetical protein EVAR_88406_1 [Eumeta japonica]